MFYLPEVVTNAIESLLDEDIVSVKPISGGDINEARLVTTPSHAYFLKMNDGPNGGAMLQTEQLGLELLGEYLPTSLEVPAVIGYTTAGSYACLVLEYIESGQAWPVFWQVFGRGLADLHRCGHSDFGLDHNNFIARLPQNNEYLPDWPSFYYERRLQPQAILAYEARLLELHDMEQLQQLGRRLADWYPNEPPSLIHGDLWSGNYLVSAEGRPILIDPAVSYSHREMDLAMSRLFGGFPAEFYTAYHEAYPLAAGWEERLELGQLYYLLVHLNLFGKSYLDQVKQILARFA